MKYRPPGPLSREDESLEARIRMKLDMRQALSTEERAFFGRMNADKPHGPEEL